MDTPRLYLRPWKTEDAADLYDIASSPKVGPYCGWPMHESVEESGEVIRSMLMNRQNHAIVLKETGKVIGNISMHKDSLRSITSARVREIGYYLGENYFGHGYMSEAVECMLEYGFTELELEMVTAAHFSFNERSRRLINRLDFHYDATIPKWGSWPGGEDFDLLLYSMTKEAFEALH